MMRFFATCPKGIESLLLKELTELGAADCRETVAGVYCEGELELAYRICLGSQLASRLLLRLSEFEIDDEGDLYRAMREFPWEQHFDETAHFAIDFNGVNRSIRNTQFGAVRVKDAIVDRFTEICNARPSVDKRDPDIRINVHLKRTRVTVSLDLSGHALHQRGYRQEGSVAPLKENLAAAVLMRSLWNGEPLLDPLCGSGTLLIEAAFRKYRLPVGVFRARFGFEYWLGHDRQLWQTLRDEAKQSYQRIQGLSGIEFFGYDHDSKALERAQRNAERAGLSHLIHFEKRGLNTLTAPCSEPGYVISNPPYGVRIGEIPELLLMYHQFGQLLKQHFAGWTVTLLSGSSELLNMLRLRSEKTYKLYNGALECELRNYRLAADLHGKLPLLVAADFANRLRKNLKQLDKWVRQEALECYRIYDADLPDYNAAIDRYGDWLVIQEYAAPVEIEEYKVTARFQDLVVASMEVTGVAPEHVILKVRRRQKGDEQYQKQSDHGERFVVNEYGAKLWVNLTDYLDTGLFLDHRNTRRMIQEMAKGKRFLNLFAYTGSASVHAGLGGAKATTTVDMSSTYLDWTKDNLKLNGLVGRHHRVIRADCLSWLKECAEQFDLIFLDPPTFSNSKKMDDDFDVQRDHAMLLGEAKRLLAPEGILIFSNNKRHFKMAHEALATLGLQAEEITHRSQPKDFARNKQIHNCWLIRHQI